jgi:hypothetical protein
MQPHDDLFLLKAALRIAGGYRELQRRTSVTRQVYWRLLEGRQKNLNEATRQRLREFIGG